MSAGTVMAAEQTRYTFDRVVRMVLSALTLTAVFFLLRYLSDVLLPFAVAVVLAYLLNPIVVFLERTFRSRALAVAATLLGLTIVAVSLIAIMLPLMVSQVTRFRDSLAALRTDLSASVETRTPSTPDTIERMRRLVAELGETEEVEAPPFWQQRAEPQEPMEGDPIERMRDFLKSQSPVEPPPEVDEQDFGWSEFQEAWERYREQSGKVPRAQRLREFREHIQGTYIGVVVEQVVVYTRSDEFNELLFNAAKRLAASGWTVLTFAINLVLGLTGLIIVALYLVFLLLDYPAYVETWKSFLPPKYRQEIIEFAGQFNLAMRRYFRGQSVIALLTGALLALGFTLIGLPMAIPLGLMVGLLNLVPYLQAVGLVPAMLMAGLRAIEGDAGFLSSVVLTLLVFAVVQVIQDTLLMPRIMGKATGLRPVAILLGVFVWGKLLGVLGLLLAIPLTCLGIAYYTRFVLKQKGQMNLLAPEPSPGET